MQEIKLDGQEAIAATVNASGDEEFWKSHVLTAQKFTGSDEEYCKQNGISLSRFNDHKKKHGMTRRYQRRRSVVAASKATPKAFLKIECKPEPAKVVTAPSSSQSRVRPRDSTLPDPKWMPEFVTELLALR